MKPLVFDICCGLGGWTDGFLAEGWDVIGIDIERRPYPAQLWLQDLRTIHGSQLRHADAIVASPPCTEYSYMAMPWSRGKLIAAALRGERGFPNGYDGSMNIAELNALFEACFRIQREASEAAGRYIPMVVENVKGAQPWVGKARAAFGSFYLWGDVDSIGGRIVRRGDIRWGVPSVKAATRGQKFNPDGTEHGQGSWFAIADSKNRGARKNGDLGGSWFPQGNGSVIEGNHGRDGLKLPGNNTSRMWADREVQRLADAPVETVNDADTFGWSKESPLRDCNSKSPRRKQASAKIAMIPLPLSTHIARIFKPGAGYTGMGMKSLYRRCAP